MLTGCWHMSKRRNVSVKIVSTPVASNAPSILAIPWTRKPEALTIRDNMKCPVDVTDEQRTNSCWGRRKSFECCAGELIMWTVIDAGSHVIEVWVDTCSRSSDVYEHTIRTANYTVLCRTNQKRLNCSSANKMKMNLAAVSFIKRNDKQVSVNPW